MRLPGNALAVGASKDLCLEAQPPPPATSGFQGLNSEPCTSYTSSLPLSHTPSMPKQVQLLLTGREHVGCSEVRLNPPTREPVA